MEQKIEKHLKNLLAGTGQQDNDEALEAMKNAWQEKQEIFERQVGDMKMEMVDSLGAEERRGGLLMTYSGSLITLGPADDEMERRAEYTSIGLRQDVPGSAESDATTVKNSVDVDQSLELSGGPIEKSSPIFKIALVNEGIEAEEQDELLAEVTRVITDDFVELNKTIIIE